MSTFDPQPLVLEGEHVRLEPLRAEHLEGLIEAGRDESIWTWLPRGPFADIEEAREWFLEAQYEFDNGVTIPFTTIHRASGRVAGSTRYLDIQRPSRGLEIGWTWISPEFQRTALNTECKLLLLRHAFEEQGAARVQFKTDARNLPSQRALERLGATPEGTLRRNLRVREGFLRDSVYYSILEDEWPDVRARLENFLRERTT